MSVFGKKSMINWNYDDHTQESAIKFNRTKPELQLEILKKWYPIGTNFVKWYDFNFKYSSSTKYTIIGYNETSYGFGIRYSDNKWDVNSVINPIYTIIDPEFIKSILRNDKLNKLI